MIAAFTQVSWIKLAWLKSLKTVTRETVASFPLIKLESRCRIRTVLLYDTHFYLFFFCCLRNWYRMQKMPVPQRLGFYMMKLSMEQKRCGQRTWHNIRVNIIFINFGRYSSICMWFCGFPLAVWRWAPYQAHILSVLTLIIPFQSQCFLLKALHCLCAVPTASV